MNYVEVRPPMLDSIRCQVEKVQRISLDELKGVARLGLNVYPHNLEPGPVVAHRGTAGPTEQIQ
jgi:hypothetical protein